MDSQNQPDGCICDGSGWAELEIYRWSWAAWLSLEDTNPWQRRTLRCDVCHARLWQQAMAVQSGLLDSELDLSLADVVPNGPDTALMLDMAHAFCAAPWGMWTLWGSYGAGKTLILQAIVNHFRRQGTLAVYVRFSDLLDYVRAGFDPGRHTDPDTGQPDDHLARYRRLMGVKILAIDEVDKARLTAYAEEFQAAFLDDRWRYGVERDPDIRRHTLLGMNDNPAGLPGHLYDRLRDGRFGCLLPATATPDNPDGWQCGITRNMDESMRPAMVR